MPDITTQELFPSVAFIGTNAKGDLQEVVGVDEASASLLHSGLTFTAATPGVNGNSLKVEIVGSNSAGAAVAVFDSGTSQLNITLPTAQATAANLTIHGLTFTAATPGAAGNNIRVRFRVGQAVTGVEVSVSGNDITIDSQNTTAATSQGDIKTAFDNASISIASLSVANAAAAMASNISTYESLTSGTDAIAVTDSTQGEVKTAFDAASISEMSIAIEAAGTSLTGELSSSSLTGGLDEVTNQLEKSEKYILIKESDLYDFDGTTEATDGRKVLWGILHNASEVWAAAASQPDNLTIARSAVQSSDGGASLKQTYTITAKYAVSGLDLKPE